MKAEFKVSYLLWTSRADKKTGRVPLYIRSKQNSTKQTSYSLGKIKAVLWDAKTNNVRKAIKDPELRDELEALQNRLKAFEGKLQDTYTQLMDRGKEPTLEMIREEWKKPTVGRPSKNLGIVAWCDHYLKSAKYSEGQKKAVGTLKSNIKSFNETLTFKKINTETLTAFFDHLTENGVANNSQYKRLRALINVASHAGMIIPDLTAYKITGARNALKSRLHWPEVKKVMETKTENNLEAIAKDTFLIACFSGLRISDILTLNQGKMHDYYYERIQTKTDEPVKVTLHKYNSDLFQKYIKTGIGYTRQRLSTALKNVLERAGLTEDVIRRQQVGNLRTKKAIPKFKDVSFHSGRRFYARLLSDLGLGEEVTRDELGHSFKNVTQLYSGSQEHAHRVARVRKAMESLEEKMEQLDALMKVA